MSVPPMMDHLVAVARQMPEHIDPTMRQMARFSFYDFITVGLAGSHEPVADIMRQFAHAEGGSPDCTIFGSEASVPPRLAALPR